MQVIVNGKATDCGAQATVYELILSLELKPETVVVERNRQLVKGDDFAATRLEEGDTLEVLHFVGGG